MEVLVLAVLVLAAGAAAFALVWHQAGVPPLEGIQWRLNGFSAKDAHEWRVVPITSSPVLALVWRRAGLTPDDARWCAQAGVDVNAAVSVRMSWSEEGLPFQHAMSWTMWGFAPADHRPWIHILGPTGEPCDPATAAAWRSLGFDPGGAAAWHHAGIAPQHQGAWSATGCAPAAAGALQAGGASPATAPSWLAFTTPEEVGAWVQVFGDDPAQALEWSKRGFDSAATRGWVGVAFGLDEAEQWRSHGFGPEPDTAKWRASFGDATVARGWRVNFENPLLAHEYQRVGFTPLEATAWHEAALAPPDAREWADAEFDAATASQWHARDFNPIAASRWRQQDCDPVEASAWRTMELTSDEAAQWKEVGFAADDARAWIEAKAAAQEAALWRANGFDGASGVRWREEKFEPADAKAWRVHFEDPGLARQYRRAAFTPPDAHAWWTHDVGPEDARNWSDARFEPVVARAWIDEQFGSSVASKWRDAEFDAATAARWRTLDLEPEQARLWTAAGFYPDDCREWVDAEVAPADAALWGDAGFDGVTGVTWLTAGFDPASAREWQERFADPRNAAEYRNAGFEHAEAQQWQRVFIPATKAIEWRGEGFDPPAAKAWQRCDFAPSAARAWRTEGFEPVPATSWLAKGFEPEQAAAWQEVEPDAERAAGFQAAGFSFDVEGDVEWIDTPLSGAHASAWRDAGLNPEAATRPLSEALDDLEFDVAAQLLLRVHGDQADAASLEALHAIAEAPFSEDRHRAILEALPPTVTGAGAALGMHEAATGEIVPSLQARDVAAAGLGTFDDLVDLGLRPRDFLLAIAEGLPDDVRDYARARVAPDELTDDQLRSVGNHGELARRAYLAGDAAALADLPQGTDVKAMADLLAARGGDQTVWQKGAPSKTARIVGRGPRQAPDLEALALDPTTWPVVSSDVAQLVIDRRSPLSLSDRGAAMVEWCLMDATRSQLRNWAWADVCSTAKAWIERAGTPEARAEGLNCLGAALHQLGDDVAAREALESALGETASSGLLINRAWLALDDDPTAAVLDLAKAATTAVGTELVDITVLAISEHERHGPGQVPPPELVEAARKAAIARGTLDAHVTVLHFLERTDPKWLALARNTAGSPHARTWEHRVRVAAAGDLAEYISVLGKAAAAERSPSWVSGECRRLVRDAVTAAASDDIDGVYAYAVLQALLNAGIVQDPLEHAALACFAARKGLSTLEPGEENPSDELLGMLQTAQNKLRSASGAERAQRQAEVTKTIDLFALLRVAFIRSELQVAFDTYKEIVERLRASGGSRAVSQSAREAGRRIRGTVQELTRDLDAVTRLATETDVKADAREARDAAHALSEALEVFDQ